jgi:type II secretory pathway component GspD/PulD (secretin)
MKRTLPLFVLVVALAFSSALAQTSTLPADERFSQPVSFSTGSNGESLRAMITALARTIGLTPIVDGVPDRTIVYDIGDPKPFRQVWDLVLSLNDLSYVLQENDVVVVGTRDSLARLRTAPAEGDEPSVQRFYRVHNDIEQVATILRRAVRDIVVETLPGTSALVVIGTEGQQDDVVAALAEFDRPADIIPLEQRTYFLSNAVAADLATTLQATVQLGAGGEVLESFTVVAEPRSNALIVTGTAAAQRRLADLIAQLDSPQRQVNVQVRIQEISRRAAFDLGIDWSTGFGNLTTQILSGGLGFIFDTTQVISSLNVLAVLDTLETQGLTRRVDDSNLTVLDNGTGSIQSGGTIFISLPGATENIERTIPYGVQIDVTPRISADGRITLAVEASVEDVLSTTNDPTFLNLSTRAVTTTVTVQPGQTILLGGLLQNSLSLTQSRIPILGSLPIIGGLFGRTVSEEDTVDLLLVITAQIID